MSQYIVALLLLGLVLLLLVLQKTYYYFPARELKRQARAGDSYAAVLYRAVAYGGSLRLLLWLLIGLATAGSFCLLTAVAPLWLVFLAVLGVVWYGFAWTRHATVTGVGARVVGWCTPSLAWLLYYLHPPLDAINRFLTRHRPGTFHTGLFERSDLLELLEVQKGLADSRISKDEISLVQHALSFGDKTVHAVMIPKRDVKTVRQSDVIGPILMDELYESGFSRFPVLARDGDIVGILFLRDLIHIKHGGKVADVMKRSVNFVHEEQSLYQALHAFLTTKQHMFVVINSSANYVGIIAIEDVLEQIIGHKIEQDFDAYDDRSAVAKSLKQPPKLQPVDTEAELPG